MCCLAFTWFFASFGLALLIKKGYSWLASPRTRYYFRLCFSFNCSGYDLTLIQRNHIFNCYLFLQKFLLKTKSYKLAVGNCDSSVYCCNDKFKKAIYYLPLMSCSRNILSLTCYSHVKILCSPILPGKNFLLKEMVGGWRPAPPSFLYGPVSRSKGNQLMTFGQLIEYSLRIVFQKMIHKMWWRS